MTKSSEADGKQENTRRARLAEELRANLQRRKRQARSRREGTADDRAEGIEASSPATNE